VALPRMALCEGPMARVECKVTHTVVEALHHAGQRYLIIGFDAPRYECLLPLSPCELQVVQAFIEGQSMRAIARERGVVPRTVENQITRAYRKLGVKSRNELLSLVLQGASTGVDREQLLIDGGGK
jgi:protein AroM